MSSLKNAAVLALMSTLTACAAGGPQVYRSAQQTLPSNSYTIGTLQDTMVSDHMHRFLDKGHTVYYMQNQGGGGAAAGLLLGPLGVLANVAAIKSQTNKDATDLQDKIPVDVQAVFHTSLTQATTLSPAAQGGQEPVLAPALFVEKLDDEHLRFASMLCITTQVGGKSMLRQYVYELPESYSRQALAHGLTTEQVAQLNADLKTGFDWIVSTYVQDLQGAFKPSSKATIRSEFVTPRIQVPQVGYGFDAGTGRIGFAIQNAVATTVYSVPDGAATLTM